MSFIQYVENPNCSLEIKACMLDQKLCFYRMEGEHQNPILGYIKEDHEPIKRNLSRALSK